MNANIITQKVKSILESDSTLSNYVAKFYLGNRENVPDSNFPCIFIHPVKNDESAGEDLNTLLRLHWHLLIVGCVHAMDVEKQLIGDDNYKGIMDLENDIKKALDAYYPNLGGTGIVFNFIDSAYDNQEWPVWKVYITVDIYYQQTRGTRS